MVKEGTAKYGLDDPLPAFVYFEEGVPNIYDNENQDLVEWIEEQRTSDTIEKVTEEILQMLANDLKASCFFVFDHHGPFPSPTIKTDIMGIFPQRSSHIPKSH